jgi:hypothetical protein
MTVNILGGSRARRTKTSGWYWPLLPTAIAAFALSALVAYHLRAGSLDGERSFLQATVVWVYEFFGFAPSFLFFLLVLSWRSIWMVVGKLDRPHAVLGRLCGLVLALSIWVNLRAEPGEVLPHTGLLGGWVADRMVGVLGYYLSLLLVAPVTFAALLLATDYFFIRYFDGSALMAGDDEPGVEEAVPDEFKVLSARVDHERAEERRGEAAFDVEDARSLLQSMVYEPIASQPEGATAIELVGLDSGRDTGELTASQSVDEEAAARAFQAFPGDSELAARSAGRHVGEDAVDEVLDVAAGGAGDLLADAGGLDTAVGQGGGTAQAGLEEGAPAGAHEPSRGRLAPLWQGEDVAEDGVSEADASAGDVELTVVEDPISDGEVEVQAGGDEDVAVDAGCLPFGQPVRERECEEPVEGYSTEVTEPSAEAAADEDSRSVAGDEAAWHSVEQDEVELAEVEGTADVAEARAEADSDAVVIPRPAEGVQQQRLFVTTLEESLIQEAKDVVLGAGRASANLLQRRLRVDYEQAMELLAVLSHRGVVELGSEMTQGRVIV